MRVRQLDIENCRGIVSGRVWCFNRTRSTMCSNCALTRGFVWAVCSVARVYRCECSGQGYLWVRILLRCFPSLRGSFVTYRVDPLGGREGICPRVLGYLAHRRAGGRRRPRSGTPRSAPDPRELAALYSRLLAGPRPPQSRHARASRLRMDGRRCGLPRGPKGRRSTSSRNPTTCRPCGRRSWVSSSCRHTSTSPSTASTPPWPGRSKPVRPLLNFQPQDHVRVMLDPTRHPFCLFATE